MIDDAVIDELVAAVPVADAHADSLMWNRDLNARSGRGHLDFPRLLEARARLQCFTLVTRGFPVVDGFGTFSRVFRWPRAARQGEWARAQWQIDQLERFCVGSGGRVLIARTKAELAACSDGERCAAVLGVEGAHALEGRPERVRELWDRGVRFMSLTHLTDNEIGGASFPLGRQGGLTELGREVLAQMAAVGMAVDLAHASARTIFDVLSGPETPVFCSHTGIGSVTRSWRNLDDDTLREIARRNGVACVIFATSFLGGNRLSNLARHIERAVEVAGEDFVGLGSDYDGMIRLPRPMRDVRDVRAIARVLIERGMEPPVVAKVLGENLWRFFERVMPGSA